MKYSGKLVYAEVSATMNYTYDLNKRDHWISCEYLSGTNIIIMVAKIIAITLGIALIQLGIG